MYVYVICILYIYIFGTPRGLLPIDHCLFHGVLSTLAHWSPAMAELPYLPALVFPLSQVSYLTIGSLPRSTIHLCLYSLSQVTLKRPWRKRREVPEGYQLLIATIHLAEKL